MVLAGGTTIELEQPFKAKSGLVCVLGAGSITSFSAMVRKRKDTAASVAADANAADYADHRMYQAAVR